MIELFIGVGLPSHVGGGRRRQAVSAVRSKLDVAVMPALQVDYCRIIALVEIVRGVTQRW